MPRKENYSEADSEDCSEKPGEGTIFVTSREGGTALQVEAEGVCTEETAEQDGPTLHCLENKSGWRRRERQRGVRVRRRESRGRFCKQLGRHVLGNQPGDGCREGGGGQGGGTPFRASDGPSPGAGRGAEKGGGKKLPKEESMRFGR